jgi:hypothetical protein
VGLVQEESVSCAMVTRIQCCREPDEVVTKVDVFCAGVVVVVDGELDSSLMIAVEVGEVETGKSSKMSLRSR